MVKTAKTKRRTSEVTAVCKTAEEEVTMTILIVYCQAAYRQLKKAGKNVTLQRIVDNAFEELQYCKASITTKKLARIILEDVASESKAGRGQP